MGGNRSKQVREGVLLRFLSTPGCHSTTLEANAAMKTIVRTETVEDWRAYVVCLMKEAAAIEPVEEPTDEDVRRFDKKRKSK